MTTVLGEVSSRGGHLLIQGEQLLGSGCARPLQVEMGQAGLQDSPGPGSMRPTPCVLQGPMTPQMGLPVWTSGTGRLGHVSAHLKSQAPTLLLDLGLRVPPRQRTAHHWSPGSVVPPASGDGHAYAGNCSLGPSVGGRPPQTAACGGAARIDRSLWGGERWGSGPAGPRGCSHHWGDTCISSREQINRRPWWPPPHSCSTTPRAGPSVGSLCRPRHLGAGCASWGPRQRGG